MHLYQNVRFLMSASGTSAGGESVTKSWLVQFWDWQTPCPTETVSSICHISDQSNFSNTVKKALSVRCRVIHSPKVDIRSDSVSHSNITELQSFPDNHWLVQGKTQKENRCAHKNLRIFSFTAFRTVWQATYLLAHCFLLCTTMRCVHQHLLPRQLFKLWEPVGRSGEAQQYGTSLFPPWR